MWLKRLKPKARNRPETPAVSSPTFSVSSFKDIETLFEEGDNNYNNNIVTRNRNFNAHTRKSKFVNVFHRVRNATSLLKAFSNQKKVEGNAQESNQRLKSLLRDRKDKGVVSKKNHVLIEEKPILEVHDSDVNAQESNQTLTSLLRDDKEKRVVLEKRDLDKDQSLIEKPKSIGEVHEDVIVQESNRNVKSLDHGDKDHEVVLGKGDLETKEFLIEDPTLVREVVDDDVYVRESIQTSTSLHHGDKDNKVVLEIGDVEKKPFLIEDPTLVREVVDDDVYVQESIQTSTSLHHGDKDNEVVLEKGKFLIDEPTSIREVDDVNVGVSVDDSVNESIQTSKSLHHGDKDDGVAIEKGKVLIDEPTSNREVDDDVNVGVSVDDSVKESIQTSKSLHHGDKDDGVSLEKGKVLIDEAKSISEVDDVNVGVTVDDSVKESIQTSKSLHHGDKDDGLVLASEDSEKNRILIEEPTTIGDVCDVNVDDNRDGVVPIQLPGAETRVVIFFTSLRVVRPTFEACKYARTILHSFPVAIDERDLFMDGSFMKELQSIMGIDDDIILTLPRVFIGGRYFGGAEEIRKLHEAGELKKYLEGLAPAPVGTCEECGGHGFILCIACNGSHKCYDDKEGFTPCSICNENGLVRCPSCSSAPF